MKTNKEQKGTEKKSKIEKRTKKIKDIMPTKKINKYDKN